MATAVARVRGTVPSDPTIKSRTFVAPLKQGYLSATLRSTQEGASILPTETVLAIPRWVSPQFKGRFFLK